MVTFKEFISEGFRYRAPSLKTLLGITAIKKKIRKDLGINTIARYKPSRIKQRVKQDVGLYGNKKVTFVRQLMKGKLPSLFKFIPKL